MREKIFPFVLETRSSVGRGELIEMKGYECRIIHIESVSPIEDGMRVRGKCKAEKALNNKREERWFTWILRKR